MGGCEHKKRLSTKAILLWLFKSVPLLVLVFLGPWVFGHDLWDLHYIGVKVRHEPRNRYEDRNDS